MPDVRDLPEPDAVAALEAAGLVVTDTESRANDDIAAGDALRTEPEAGTEVDPGSGVTLIIAAGPAPVSVPDLVGLARGEARDALEAAGLVVGDAPRSSDAPPATPSSPRTRRPTPRCPPAPASTSSCPPAPPRSRCPRCATCPSPTRSPRSRPPVSS